MLWCFCHFYISNTITFDPCHHLSFHRNPRKQDLGNGIDNVTYNVSSEEISAVHGQDGRPADGNGPTARTINMPEEHVYDNEIPQSQIGRLAQKGHISNASTHHAPEEHVYNYIDETQNSDQRGISKSDQRPSYQNINPYSYVNPGQIQGNRNVPKANGRADGALQHGIPGDVTTDHNDVTTQDCDVIMEENDVYQGEGAKLNPSVYVLAKDTKDGTGAGNDDDETIFEDNIAYGHTEAGLPAGDSAVHEVEAATADDDDVIFEENIAYR